MWNTFFRDGGWGMYPVTVFGLLLVAAAVLCVLRPERRFARIAGVLGVATLCAGFLGTSVGFIMSFRYLSQVPVEQRFTIAALGCAESLNDTVLALMLVVFSSLLGAVAATRAALREPSTPGVA